MPDTPLYLTEHFRRQFEDVWNQQVQQMESKFASVGMIDGSWTTKEKVFTDLSTIDWTENNDRFGRTNPEEVTGGKRKGYRRFFEVARKFDKNDKQLLERMNLPDSEVMQAMKYGWERKMDDVFLDSAIADSLGGPDPFNTPVPLPATSQIAVNFAKPGGTPANIGLTPWKILEIKRRFGNANIDIDREELYLGISPQQEMELWLYVETSPNDIWAQVIAQWLKDRNQSLMGFRPIISTRLPLNTTNDVRTCVAFTRRAFTLSSDHMEIKINELPSERHCIQIAAYAQKGAVRRYDERVQLIFCDQSP